MIPDHVTPHPAIAHLPMLPPDAARQLTDDIRADGLRLPIVIDDSGRILNGRNRYRACLAAGVAPRFVTYAGGDPEGYALRAHSGDGCHDTAWT